MVEAWYRHGGARGRRERLAPGCEDEMLALIGCVRGATCGEDTCEAAEERLETCAEASAEPDDKPLTASPT